MAHPIFTRPIFTRLILNRLPATLALASLIATAPYTMRLDAQSGLFSVEDSTAEARRGRGADDTHREDRRSRPGRSVTPTPPAGGAPRVTKVERSGSTIEVRYSDGTREEIEGGRYERKNAAGRTVEERRATAADIARLSTARR